MPFSSAQQSILDRLNLKEGIELYTLATVLIKASHNPRGNKQKSNVSWDTAVDTVLKAIESNLEYNGITPLELFMALSTHMQKPQEFLDTLQNAAKKRGVSIFTAVLRTNRIQNTYFVERIQDIFAYHINRGGFSIVDVLLQMNTPIDFLSIDSGENSLLNAIIQSRCVSSIGLITNKLEQCPLSLTHPNQYGNTPLHNAFLNNASQNTVLELINVLNVRKLNLNTLNQKNLSPLYLAISKNRLVEATKLLENENVSVSHQYTDSQGKQMSALHLWVEHCTTFKPLSSLTTEKEIIELKQQLEKTTHFALQLLMRGCHYDVQILGCMCLKLYDFRVLWIGGVASEYVECFTTMHQLDAAWKQIEHIENCKVPYSDFRSFLRRGFINTRRVLDNKTMFDIILTRKIYTQNNLQVLQSKCLNPCPESLTEREKKQLSDAPLNMVYYNTFLLLLILHGATIGESTDTEHLHCVAISKKINSLKAQKPMVTEACCIEQGEEICTGLEALNHTDYGTFKALCYYEMAECLFALDKERNIPQITTRTLRFIQNLMQKAMMLADTFESGCILFSKQIRDFNFKISPYLPDTDPYQKMSDCLRVFIQPEEERKLKKERRDVCSQIDMLLSNHGHDSLDLSEDPQPPLCIAIPAALKRGNEKIETLRGELQSLKETLKASKIREAALEAQLFKKEETATEKPGMETLVLSAIKGTLSPREQGKRQKRTFS